MWKNRLFNRIVWGTILSILTVAIILLFPPMFLAVFVGIWVTMATREFLLLLQRAEISLNQWLLITLNLLMLILAQYRLIPALIILPMGIVFITALLHPSPLPRIPVYGLFTITYLGFLPSHLILLQQLAIKHSYSSWLTLFPLIISWVSDTAAYVGGQIFGRHKLAPMVSPQKTVEGALAGLITAGILAGIWLPMLTPFRTQPRFLLVLIGIGLSVIGQIGDIFESTFKRAVGVKDSAPTLGEHGGFLDRADSLLFTIPTFYYLTLLTNQ